jgi:hypothetical protein
MSKAKEIITLDTFQLISLSGFPHIIITQKDKYYGEIMTKSKFIYVKSEKIETIEINKEQKMIFSLFNKQDLINDNATCNEKLYKIFKTLNIDDSKKFIGFMYKINLLYLTEIGEKLL